MRKDGFEYTYSAVQQEEIKNIRAKYLDPSESETTLEKVKRLDKKAEQKGMITSLVLGVIGTTLLGIGMSLTMEWVNYFIPGIVIGVVGILFIVSAYPTYTHITKIERKKMAPEILKMTDQLIQK